jgi:hypothetical protein
MGFLKNVLAKRMSGQRPSPPVAAGAAIVAGAVVAVVVYKALRAGE